MSGQRNAPDGGSAPTGAATSRKGTPRGVDVSGDPRHRTTVAVLLAGPVIWTLHFMLVYLVLEAGCTGDGPGFNLFDPPVPTIVTLVATGLATVACLVTARWAYRRWRTDERDGSDAEAGVLSTRDAPLAFVGFLLSLLGAVVVLFVGLPALVLPACLP